MFVNAGVGDLAQREVNTYLIGASEGEEVRDAVHGGSLPLTMRKINKVGRENDGEQNSNNAHGVEDQGSRGGGEH